MEKVDRLKKIADRMRIKALKMAYNAGNKGAHIGGGMSLIEIMAVLYKEVAKLDSNNPKWEERDRIILSKGHGVLAYYTALNEAGYIKEEELERFEENEGILPGHPVMNLNKGIEMSSGSLGMGLSFGIGSAIAGRMNKKQYNVYVIIGDGECNEGSIWEGIMSAAHFKLNNLTMIIDCNGLQYDGKTEEILGNNSLIDKFKAFNWNVVEVDGHNIEELLEVFSNKIINDKPNCIIAKTVKGKGIIFAENKKEWHHNIVTKKNYEEAISVLEGVNFGNDK